MRIFQHIWSLYMLQAIPYTIYNIYTIWHLELKIIEIIIPNYINN